MPNEFLKDGDISFVGLNSRDNPASLSAGIVSRSQNFRMDRGVATARKGLQRKTIGSLVGQTIYGTGTYILSSGQEVIVIVVADGLYSYNPQTEILSSKVYFPSRVTGKTLTSTTSLTVTVTSAAHGLLAGANVYVECSSVGYTGLFVISSVTTNTFTYTMPAVASAGAVSGVACSYSAAQLVITPDGCDVCNALDKVFISRGFDKRPLMWDLNVTITALPTSGAGHAFPNCSGLMFYANRLIALGKHHNEPTALRNYDTVSVSNFLDYENWDAVDAFTINNGGNDQVVSIAPWTLNEFLVFMRNSIFYINTGNDRYVSGDGLSATSYIKTLATDIGCSARKSVVQAGGGVFFLSDSGVYFLQPQPASAESMKLLTMADPISAPIDNVIQRINKNYAYRAVATYWNNRYYLAVPLDDSTVNNTVLVYNFILRQWESVDTYPTLVTTKNSVAIDAWAIETNSFFFNLDYFCFRIDKALVPYHGLAVGDYVNVSFLTAYNVTTSTFSSVNPPSGTYKVIDSAGGSALGFAKDYFWIQVPKSKFEVLPYVGDPAVLANWTYYQSNTPAGLYGLAGAFAKAESVSLKEFIVAKKNNQRRMFLIDNVQGIFLTEELDFDEFGDSIGNPVLPNPITGVDTPAYIALGLYGNLILVSSLTLSGAPNPNVIILEPLAFGKNDINAVLETRQYSFNGINDKRFSSYEANLLTSGGEYIETYVNALNPDISVRVDALGSSSLEDYNRSNPIRKTGSHASIKFISYSKRPSIRSAFIYAKQQNKNNLNKQ